MTDTVVNSGRFVANLTLYNGDTLEIDYGGSASDVTIDSGGEAFDGGVTSATLVHGGGIEEKRRRWAVPAAP
jgi:autotransporter passenger strand-loop-strand repeat protein